LTILVELFFILCNNIDKFTQKCLHAFGSLYELLNLDLGFVEFLIGKLSLQKEVRLDSRKIEYGSSNVVLLNEGKLFFKILLWIEEDMKLIAVQNIRTH
jgi:hypothetical protein